MSSMPCCAAAPMGPLMCFVPVLCSGGGWGSTIRAQAWPRRNACRLLCSPSWTQAIRMDCVRTSKMRSPCRSAFTISVLASFSATPTASKPGWVRHACLRRRVRPSQRSSASITINNMARARARPKTRRARRRASAGAPVHHRVHGEPCAHAPQCVFVRIAQAPPGSCTTRRDRRSFSLSKVHNPLASGSGWARRRGSVVRANRSVRARLEWTPGDTQPGVRVAVVVGVLGGAGGARAPARTTNAAAAAAAAATPAHQAVIVDRAVQLVGRPLKQLDDGRDPAPGPHQSLPGQTSRLRRTQPRRSYAWLARRWIRCPRAEATQHRACHRQVEPASNQPRSSFPVLLLLSLPCCPLPAPRPSPAPHDFPPPPHSVLRAGRHRICAEGVLTARGVDKGRNKMIA